MASTEPRHESSAIVFQPTPNEVAPWPGAQTQRILLQFVTISKIGPENAVHIYLSQPQRYIKSKKSNPMSWMSCATKLFTK